MVVARPTAGERSVDLHARSARSAPHPVPWAIRLGPAAALPLPPRFVPPRFVRGIWYIVGFAFAGVTFVFMTIGAAWLVSHRNRGDVHKGLPYESGIDTYGDTHGRFGLSFYIYALLFVAFDIEVVFIYLWAIAFQSLLLGGLISMLIFVSILLLGLAYAWRKGALSWR